MNAAPLWHTGPSPPALCAGKAGGARCPGRGQCCDEVVGICLTGVDHCSRLPVANGRQYDGPPGTHTDPYRDPTSDSGDRPSDSCGEAVGEAPLKCGPKANALCPWSPHGQDLFCVVDGGNASTPFPDASCLPLVNGRGAEKDILLIWDGRWLPTTA
jgi:hypothetical protein